VDAVYELSRQHCCEELVGVDGEQVQWFCVGGQSDDGSGVVLEKAMQDEYKDVDVRMVDTRDGFTLEFVVGLFYKILVSLLFKVKIGSENVKVEWQCEVEAGSTLKNLRFRAEGGASFCHFEADCDDDGDPNREGTDFVTFDHLFEARSAANLNTDFPSCISL